MQKDSGEQSRESARSLKSVNPGKPYVIGATIRELSKVSPAPILISRPVPARGIYCLTSAAFFYIERS